MRHIRLAAMQKLTAMLSEIKTANGCSIDVARVTRNLPMATAEDTIPMIAINEAIRSGDYTTAGEGYKRNDTIDFLMVMWTKSTNASPDEDAYALIGEVEKVFARAVAINPSNGNPMYPDDYLLGDLVVKVTWSPAIIHNPPDKVKSHTYAYFQFQITFAYDAIDPFVK